MPDNEDNKVSLGDNNKSRDYTSKNDLKDSQSDTNKKPYKDSDSDRDFDKNTEIDQAKDPKYEEDDNTKEKTSEKKEESVPISLMDKLKSIKNIPKKYFVIIGILILLIPLSYILYQKLLVEKQEKLEFDALLTKLLPYVRGEVNSFPPPPSNLLLKDNKGEETEETRLLKEGVSFFVKEEYGNATASFTSLKELLPNERRLIPLLGASNLRNMNFSLAGELFKEASNPPISSDPIVQSTVDLGQSLALLNLGDLKSASSLAKEAFDSRLSLLGQGDRQTLSAANILSGILMVMGDGLSAEEILEKTIREAISQGITSQDPLLIDSLNFLALSYELRGNQKDIASLLAKEENKDIESGENIDPNNPNQSSGSSEENSTELASLMNEPTTLSENNPNNELPNNENLANENQDTAENQSTNNPPTTKNTLLSLKYEELVNIYSELTKIFPHSPVITELLEAMISILSPNLPLCQYPGGNTSNTLEIWILCSSLEDALITQGHFEESFRITSELMKWEDLSTHHNRYLVFRNAAFQNFERGRVEGAIEFLHLALETLSQKESLSKEEVSFILLRSITLADLLISEGKPLLEIEIELTSYITVLEKKIGRKEMDTYLETPMLYWYLARVIREEGRNKDAKNFFDRALKVVNNNIKLKPTNLGEFERIKSLLSSDKNAKKGSYPNFPLSPRIFFQAEKLYSGKYPRLPSLDAMKLELKAYKALGKTSKFEKRIDFAKNFAQKENPESYDYLRYWNLKLKYLEETKDYEKFFKELDAMINAPKFVDPVNKSLFQSSAKSYEAKVRLASGDKEGALIAYQNALSLLSNIDAAPQKEAIEKEIANMTKV